MIQANLMLFMRSSSVGKTNDQMFTLYCMVQDVIVADVTLSDNRLKTANVHSIEGTLRVELVACLGSIHLKTLLCTFRDMAQI